MRAAAILMTKKKLMAMMALAMAVELIVRLDDPSLLGLLRPDHHHREVRDMAVVLTLL